MKISRNWLSNYIESDRTNSELVDCFTQLGLECNYHLINSLDSNIVVGKVVECIKHPDADRLKVCQVDIASESNLTIICGAPNVKENILVPIAKIGSHISDFEIKKTKIRGIYSYGMICSEKELGLGENHDGIMILDNNLEVGKKLASELEIKEDSIFDFDITPNRGDCFSHLGIARELSIIENLKIKKEKFDFKKNELDILDYVDVTIDDYDLCPRYACRLIKNVEVKESPLWLKKSLAAIGQKSVNNIVDLANYIMFDLGQPLHTFDYDKLNGNKIEVRRAYENEKIICLNNDENKLTSDDIVIADNSGPVAIAGVIGGLESQVTSKTTNILLESAVFNEINIRKTSKKYDYAKEASKRFERGIDYENVIYVMDKFTYLLLSDCKKAEVSFNYIDKLKNKSNKLIEFDVSKCNSFLGTALGSKEIKSIFNSLDIKFSDKKDHFKCSIPSYRNDLEREVDLFEEVARVFGYDSIESNMNFKFSINSLIRDENLIEDKLRTILSNNGFNEHYSNSLCNKKEIAFSNENAIRLMNPLSRDMEYLRNSLSPGILKALSFNEKRESEFLKYYEIGSVNVYDKNKYNLSKERRVLSLGYLGDNIKSWSGTKPFNLFNIKGDISMIFHNLGFNKISYKVDTIDNNCNYKISIILNGQNIGEIKEINDTVKNYYDISSSVVICNIELDKVNVFYNKLKISYKKTISYPSINRDIAILVPHSITHDEIINVIRKSSTKILRDVKLFDIYDDKNFDKNTKSMGYSLKFQSPDRTLKSSEVDKEIKLVLDNLLTKLNAKQR